MGIQIFISYSRSNFAYARLLRDHLEARLHCRIFMDLTAIGPGENFVEAVEKAEGSSSVVAVLIAKEWLSVDPTLGQRPVDNPENWMRQEVKAALQQPKNRIVPILLGGVSMPAAADLPDDISSLAYHQAIAVRDAEFDHDLEGLIMLLEEEIGGDLANRARTFDPKLFLADLVHYFPRFFKLIVMPKRVVHAYTAANREQEVARAMAFMVISLLIYSILSAPLLIGVQRMVTRLFVQFLLLIVLAFCSSAILQLSWRLVGGRAPFSRYLSINSYYWGVSCVLGICLVAAALGVLRTFDPHLLELIERAATGDIFPLIAARPAQSLPLRAAAWIIAVGNLLLLIWTYAFWGAYREINQTTRFRSFMAYCAACVIFLPVGLFFILVLEGLTNLLT